MLLTEMINCCCFLLLHINSMYGWHTDILKLDPRISTVGTPRQAIIMQHWLPEPSFIQECHPNMPAVSQSGSPSQQLPPWLSLSGKAHPDTAPSAVAWQLQDSHPQQCQPQGIPGSSSQGFRVGWQKEHTASAVLPFSFCRRLSQG